MSPELARLRAELAEIRAVIERARRRHAARVAEVLNGWTTGFAGEGDENESTDSDAERARKKR